MYTYDIRSVVGVYTPVGVATEWLWSVHSKLECTLRQGKGCLFPITLKSESFHNDNFVVTGGTTYCVYDSLQENGYFDNSLQRNRTDDNG